MRLVPGALSALRHAHTLQDEFVYILQGSPLLITDAGETQLHPGMCAGFKAGTGSGHQLVNRSGEEVVYLEVGDRTPGDTVSYPDEDLMAEHVAGNWQGRTQRWNSLLVGSGATHAAHDRLHHL